MKKIIFAMALIILVGCSNDNVENNNVEKVKETKEVKKINENNDVRQTEDTEVPKEKQEIDLFWEEYIGDEIFYAVSSGEKVYDFEVEAPLFEDALIESISAKEDKEWTPYLTSFNANVRGQAPPEYIKAMNNAHLSLLEDNLDLDLAIEHIKEAKRIREESE